MPSQIAPRSPKHRGSDDDENIQLIKMTPLEEGMEPSENGTATHRSSRVTITDSVLTFQSSERVDNSCQGRFQRILGRIYKVTSSIFGIIILLVGYSFLGAWIFMMIESGKEGPFKLNITNARDAIIVQLLNSSAVSTSKDTNLKETLEKMLVGYESDIMAAYKAGITTQSTVATWGFWRSLFFCGTVYTTIGYGHIAPTTDLGRGICMLYAALGIPLALLVLAELGKRFTVALKFLWAFVRRYYYAGYCRKARRPITKEDKTVQNDKHSDSKSDKGSKGSSRLVYGYEVNESFNLPISVAVTILIIYILLGACMYSIWEEWTYLEAIYFVFISLSTIGFGDVIPAHTNFFIISSLYIFIGLSLVSMCINVAIEFFHATADAAVHTVERATKSIGKKVTAAADKVHHLGHHLGTNIKDETDRIKHITDETIKKWKKKPRSRSNTPKRSISNESGSSYDSRQIEEEFHSRRESTVSTDTPNC